jgi:hypothetical protein
VQSVTKTLNEYGAAGVQAIKNDVRKVSTTGGTVNSIRFEVKSDEDSDKLLIFAREFFSTIETGRGPRKSSKDSGMKDNILEWMKVRGIGAGLPEKKLKQLAKFITLKINREGDKTFKRGGREVYSHTLIKLTNELRSELSKDFQQFAINEIRKGIKHLTKAA